MYEIKIEETIKASWANFKIYGGTLFGALFINSLIIIPIYLISYFYFSGFTAFFYNNAINIFVITPLTAGGYFIVLKMFRGQKPEIIDMFEGFKRYGAFVVLGLIYVIAAKIIFLPNTIFLYLVSDKLEYMIPGAFNMNIFMMSLLNTFIYFLIFLRFMFVYLILFDDRSVSPADALIKSSDMVKGNYVNLVLYFIVATLLTIVGFFFLVIPGVIIFLVVYISYGYIYVRLLENYNATGDQVTDQLPTDNPPAPPEYPYGQ